jgi:hypothetical protein
MIAISAFVLILCLLFQVFRPAVIYPCYVIRLPCYFKIKKILDDFAGVTVRPVEIDTVQILTEKSGNMGNYRNAVTDLNCFTLFVALQLFYICWFINSISFFNN